MPYGDKQHRTDQVWLKSCSDWLRLLFTFYRRCEHTAKPQICKVFKSQTPGDLIAVQSGHHLLSFPVYIQQRIMGVRGLQIQEKSFSQIYELKIPTTTTLQNVLSFRLVFKSIFIMRLRNPVKSAHVSELFSVSNEITNIYENDSCTVYSL